MDNDPLVPMTDPLLDDDQPAGFDVVLRGYDRRQVDDYLDRVEQALNDADARHAEDSGRLAVLEQQVADLQERLADAERRAAGLPEPVPAAGDRIATMLRLADEEATALRQDAAVAAEAMIADARVQAEQQTEQRSADLDRRERDVRDAQELADKATLQAQEDAETIRANARRDAERILEQAHQEAESTRAQGAEDLRRMHEAGQLEAAAMTAEARRQVEDLSRQRDTIAAQLQSLRDTLSGAVGPLAAPVDLGDQPTQAIRLPAEAAQDPTRAEPGA